MHLYSAYLFFFFFIFKQIYNNYKGVLFMEIIMDFLSNETALLISLLAACLTVVVIRIVRTIKNKTTGPVEDIIDPNLDKLKDIVIKAINASKDVIIDELKVILADGKVETSELIGLKIKIVTEVIKEFTSDAKNIADDTLKDITAVSKKLVDEKIEEMKKEIEE